jgi:hypothetical protein
MTTIAKIVFASVIGLGVPGAGAFAAEGYLTAQADPQGGSAPPPSSFRQDYLAPTGETLPNPGRSQIGPESEQEKGAQRKSDQDTHSICSNCE